MWNIKSTNYVFEQLSLGEIMTLHAVLKACTNITPKFRGKLVHDGARKACLCNDLKLFNKKVPPMWYWWEWGIP